MVSKFESTMPQSDVRLGVKGQIFLGIGQQIGDTGSPMSDSGERMLTLKYVRPSAVMLHMTHDIGFWIPYVR